MISFNGCMKRIIMKWGHIRRISMLDHWNLLIEQNKENHNMTNVINKSLINESHHKSTTVNNSSISPSLNVSASTLIAFVNDSPIDVSMIKLSDSNPEFLDFNHPLAKQAFWRSAAFIVSGVIEKCFGAQHYICGINDSGFYCDSFIENKNLSSEDFSIIKKHFFVIVNSKASFQRLNIDVESAKRIFINNPFKLAYLESLVPINEDIALYRCGDIVDISLSPMVRHAGQLKCLKLLATGSVRSPLTQKENTLQRIHGISFPTQKLLEDWCHLQEEAKKRDHRRIGSEQKLFFFHSSSTGSPFMLPRGTHICNKLIDLIREQYWQRGFQEVTSPDIFDCNLWKTSGHWDMYQEHLFKIPLGDERMMSLKPMNCPAHCLIYSHEERSHKDLPIRLADFGSLHRNEDSGSLAGLTRLRKFRQDDAHIFCRPDQVEEEIKASLDFLHHIYNILGFKYSLTLSTRPDRFLGEISMWDVAEQQLKDCLDRSSSPWTLNPGDGAFYGPKIDITITDAMKRDHQCATIQLDFQLPLRFDLKYATHQSSKPFERPVIIHRAILGSVERLLAIMIESNGGKWPFWLNPCQVLVVPVAGPMNSYAEKVRDMVREERFVCDADISADHTMNKKILLGQLQQYSCILVVGEKEMNSNAVNVRYRDGNVRVTYSIEDFLAKMVRWQKERTAHIENDI